jgi:hypothetical protein
VTPALSVAVAETVTLPDSVLPAVGAVIVTVGPVVSPVSAGALLFALTKPAHPVLNNDRLIRTNGRKACLALILTAPLDAQMALIDLLNILKSLLRKSWRDTEREQQGFPPRC